MTGEEIFAEAMNRNWANVPQDWIAVKEFCCINTSVVALCELVKEGVLEVIQDMGPKWNLGEWVPRYRRAQHCSAALAKTWPPPQCSAAPGSRCFKITKPWKK